MSDARRRLASSSVSGAEDLTFSAHRASTVAVPFSDRPLVAEFDSGAAVELGDKGAVSASR